MLRALEEPLRQIVANAGDEPSVVLNKVVEGKGNFGYNAQTGEYGDLVEMGVLDPTKVTRYALQNAASVAGLILTTDAMVAESPKDEKPHGGGMAAWRHGRHGRHGHVRLFRRSVTADAVTCDGITVRIGASCDARSGRSEVGNGEPRRARGFSMWEWSSVGEAFSLPSPLSPLPSGAGPG